MTNGVDAVISCIDLTFTKVNLGWFEQQLWDHLVEKHLHMMWYVKIFLMGYQIPAFCVSIKSKSRHFPVHFVVSIYRIRPILTEKKVILIVHIAQTVWHDRISTNTIEQAGALFIPKQIHNEYQYPSNSGTVVCHVHYPRHLRIRSTILSKSHYLSDWYEYLDLCFAPCIYEIATTNYFCLVFL